MATQPKIHRFTWSTKTFPRIQLAGRFPLDDRNHCATYKAPTHALHLYQYTGEIRLGRERFGIEPGDVTLSSAGAESSYSLAQPGYHLCIHFYPENDTAQSSTITLPLHIRLGIQQEFAILKIMEISRMLANVRRTKLHVAAAGAMLQELLLWLAMRQREGAKDYSGRARIAQAVEQTAALLLRTMDQPFDMETLIQEVGFSQNYLARHFRSRFGVTIPHYLLLRRIEYARHLLETTNLSIKSIGCRVGLPNPQHFNKQFRRLTGISPTQQRPMPAT